MRTKPLRLIVVIVLLTVTGSATADEVTVADPAGDQIGPMSFDIESASHGHTPRTDQYPSFLTHVVTGVRAVTDDVLESEGVQVRFNFDTRGDKSFERSIVVSYSSPGDVRADMWRGAYPFHPDGLYEPRDWVGFVEISRPDERTIQVSFPKRLLGPVIHRTDAYRWMVEVYRLPGYRSFCDDGDVSPCYDRSQAERHEL